MSELVVNYIINPFTRFWASIKLGMELSGYARAAEEFRRIGYHKEADKIYETMKKLR